MLLRRLLRHQLLEDVVGAAARLRLHSLHQGARLQLLPKRLRVCRLKHVVIDLEVVVAGVAALDAVLSSTSLRSRCRHAHTMHHNNPTMDVTKATMDTTRAASPHVRISQ